MADLEHTLRSDLSAGRRSQTAATEDSTPNLEHRTGLKFNFTN